MSRGRQLTATEKERAWYLWSELGQKQTEIAEAFGVSRNQICDIMRDFQDAGRVKAYAKATKKKRGFYIEREAAAEIQAHLDRLDNEICRQAEQIRDCNRTLEAMRSRLARFKAEHQQLLDKVEGAKE